MESSPYSELSDREWNDLSQLICAIRMSWNDLLPMTQQECGRSLKKLMELSEQFRFKLPIVDASLRVLPLLKQIVEESLNLEMKNSALTCIWYLSRHHDIYAIIGSPSLAILPLCMTLLRYSDAAYKILRNCAFDCAVHPFLLSNELGYLQFFKEEMVDFPLSVYPYHVFSAISSTLQEDCVHYFLQWRIPQIVYERLQQAGIDPRRWEGLEFGIEDHALTFLSCLSALPTGRKHLRSFEPFHFLYQVSLSKTIEGNRCLVILVNLYGDDFFPCNPHSQQLISTTFEQRKFFQRITSYASIPDEEVILSHYVDWLLNSSDCLFSTELIDAGYEYGSIMLRELIYFYYQLIILPWNETLKLSWLRERILFPSFVKILKGFQMKKGFTAPNGVGQIYVGGGWKDSLTLQYTIQIFTQFLMDYEIRQQEEVESLYLLTLQEVLPNLLKSCQLLVVIDDLLLFLTDTSLSLPIDNRTLLINIARELRRKLNTLDSNGGN